ncbi:uncharacterized protein LOC126675231 [Mercurialis annua]|uniref:uncharacterized protein LOC126675231 n=1 Tax=Mercurialis annua TaxID=3986 RepID=UPI00216043D4|nr:uncharacterized protein LOC126675231 [Mercurialis annua]
MAAPVIHSITNYAQTQRIVLLIDLTPFLHLQNPNQFLTTLISTAKNLLNFPQLSNSLFTFKPFFSSISPFLSSSKLSIPSLSLSFNRPNATLQSLTKFLNSFVSSFNKSSIPGTNPRAFHLSSSLRQLIHDYAWDPVISDCSMAGMVLNCNLVVLFSPICMYLNCLSEFFDDELSISKVFESVNDAFVSKDIHFSWVDVRYETGGCKVEFDEDGVFERGFRELGWGFCSSDCIVLGSALVPFGLIYPRIGISPKKISFDCSLKPARAQLNLEIMDVNGKPLECKCCDLELVHWNVFSGTSSKLLCEDFSNGIMKLHVKAVRKSDKCVNFDRLLSDPIVVREFSDVSADRKESCSEFFENRVLEILQMEMGELIPRKSAPILQIFLSFLYKEDYWAIVSLSNSNGDSLTGILKPFTVSLALLFIARDHCSPNSEVDGTALSQFAVKTNTESRKPKFDLSPSIGLVGSQSGTSPTEKPAEESHGKRKKNKKSLKMLREMTWISFCQAALEHFDLDLEDVCFSRGCSKSKKLKFLKCWMKQIKKTSNCSLTEPERSKQQEDIGNDLDDRLTKLPQECERMNASCSSVAEASTTGVSKGEDEAAVGCCSESLESFLNDLPHKIRQGLESEEVDLPSLANRLVNSSINWLYQKYDTKMMSDSQTHVAKSDSELVAVQLSKLLLKDPKDLVTTHRNGDQSSQASAKLIPGNIVREYELQILFRMEILHSEVGASVGESTRQKFVKQICLLLENIQCQMQAGFFGDWSLDKYVGMIIKSRYCESLGEVVQKIYERMDLLLFEDEEELPLSLLNSEDSSKPWRGKHSKEEVDENSRINVSVSAEEELLREHQESNEKEHAVKVVEAQERRQRARRFASFTSWAPDLQRVWAPKQSTSTKEKSERKVSKRKEQGRLSYDSVCETPMSGLKRSYKGIGSTRRRDTESQDNEFSLCGPVSKALFQDD